MLACLSSRSSGSGRSGRRSPAVPFRAKRLLQRPQTRLFRRIVGFGATRERLPGPHAALSFLSTLSAKVCEYVPETRNLGDRNFASHRQRGKHPSVGSGCGQAIRRFHQNINLCHYFIATLGGHGSMQSPRDRSYTATLSPQAPQLVVHDGKLDTIAGDGHLSSDYRRHALHSELAKFKTRTAILRGT